MQELAENVKRLIEVPKSGMLVMISPLGKVYDLPTTWTRGFCKQHWQLTSSQNSPEDDWATWFMRLWVFVRASNFFNPKWVVYILGRCHSVCAVCLSSRFCGGSCAHGIVQFFQTSYHSYLSGKILFFVKCKEIFSVIPHHIVSKCTEVALERVCLVLQFFRFHPRNKNCIQRYEYLRHRE